MTRPAIVHISADFPDPIVPSKTPAILRLIGLAPEFDHIVYSLNRVVGRHALRAERFGPGHTAIAYRGLPWGIGMAGNMRALAGWIDRDLAARNIAPAAIHAHKLTIEGLAGSTLAERREIPLLCSVQAFTDLKVLRARPDLRRRYRRIWHGAAHVLPFSPTAQKSFEAAFGPRAGAVTLLPCATPQDRLSRSEPSAAPRIATIFHLKNYRQKNLINLAEAVGRAKGRIPDLRLDVHGGGSDDVRGELDSRIGHLIRSGTVNLAGAAPHEKVQDMLASYTAFAMPSFGDSYGMVFAEALMAGVPILQTRNSGLYGLLPDDEIGYACADPTSVAEIAEGIVHLVENEAALKDNIARLQAQGALDIMRRPAIQARYRAALAGLA